MIKETPNNKKTFLFIFILKQMSKRLSQEEFIKKAKLIHGNKYFYNETVYKNSSSKIKIICPIHGVFEQLPNDHTSKKCGCYKCSGKGINTNDFIEKAKLIHDNKYDYSKTVYKGADYDVIITCPIHGEFKQMAYTHTNGSGCKKCTLLGRNKYDNETFINKANTLHKNKFDYSLVKYISSIDKVDIKCKKHGVFKQIPQAHLQGKGCPGCKESKGEMKIRQFLIDNDIEFISQKRFKNCKRIRPLPFDFYLPNKNVCIEFDGKQHITNKCGWFGSKKTEEEFFKIKESEEIKNKFCIENNIRLIRISYLEIEKINQKLINLKKQKT